MYVGSENPNYNFKLDLNETCCKACYICHSYSQIFFAILPWLVSGPRPKNVRSIFTRLDGFQGAKNLLTLLFLYWGWGVEPILKTAKSVFPCIYSYSISGCLSQCESPRLHKPCWLFQPDLGLLQLLTQTLNCFLKSLKYGTF